MIDRQLLSVLLAEVGPVGPQMLKSLVTTVHTPRKCPGRERAAQTLGEPLDLHPGGVARRVHLLHRWD